MSDEQIVANLTPEQKQTLRDLLHQASARHHTEERTKQRVAQQLALLCPPPPKPAPALMQLPQRYGKSW